MPEALTPIVDRALDSGARRHLLHRAGLGPSLIAGVDDRATNLDALLDSLASWPILLGDGQWVGGADGQAVSDALRDGARHTGRGRADTSSFSRWWLRQMLTSKQPLEEELALLWHNHFATNASDIAGDTGDPTSMMLDQHGLFRGYGLADGNFAELARGIIRDPAMLTYLNNDVNVKAHPNENFSRELMELFTLGEGRYSEHDVKQGARALTGYGVKDRAFHFELNDHDLNQKSILGRTGRFNGEDFVQILLEQDACALFIAQRLYRHFVADTFEDEDRDAAAVIAALAQVLRANGYQLGPALQALFRSEHFFAPSNRGTKIKSPAQLVAGTARMLGTPMRDLSVLVGEMAIMGQRLFHPPSVAGWEGGRSWLTPSTLMARQNVCIYLITGVLPAGVLASQHVGIDPLTGGMDTARAGYDPSVLLKSVDHVTPQAAVDHLTQRLLAVPCDRRERAALTAYLVHRGGQVTGDDLLGLLVLITALPAYQLC